MKKVLSFISLFLLVACSSNQPNEKKDYAFQIVNNTNTIAVSLRSDFNQENQNELKIETLPPLQEYTFNMLPAFDVLDNENANYEYGSATKSGGTKVLYFFKYTFYLKNTSDSDTTYNLKFNIKETKLDDSDSGSLIDTARLMIFENESDDTHNYGVYAYKSPMQNTDIDGNQTDREFVSVRPGTNPNREDAEYPLVTASFLESDEGCYIGFSKTGFKPNDLMRYTLVFWLEGEDAQSIATEAPMGVSIRLSAELSN